MPVIFAIILVGLLATNNQGQQKQAAPETGVPDEIVRVSTELVQTGVTVVNKQRKFVDNLNRDDFEIYVDGKSQPISFFELVKTTAPRSRSGPGKAAPSSPLTDEETAGRTVIFFVDDLHLSAESVLRTVKMIDYYVDQQMVDNDQVLIASASGQIGFLQQLTDSKEALHAAVARLKYRDATARDTDRPPMTEYQAVMIERGDEDLMSHYTSILLRELLTGLRRANAAAARDAAERMVRARAHRILAQSDSITRSTLSALESLMRSSAQLPGRKLVVMISDGFLFNNESVGVSAKLREITDAAMRAGSVIYSIQASGLNTSFPDAASTEIMDANGDTGRAPLGEDTAVQAPLWALAADTGGRALLNANDLNGAITRALDETAEYYLLAWRPDANLVRERKFHLIKVVLKAHSDLSVGIHRGFFSEVAPASAAAKRVVQEAPPSPGEQLRSAIGAIYYAGSLPTYLTAAYMENAGRPTLMILTQVPLIGINEANGNGRSVDIAGTALDANGKTAAVFGDRLAAGNATGSNTPAQPRRVTYLNQINVKPGLYQVRVAAQDSTTGYVGRAIRWIEVPDVSSGKLSLSSLFIGERDQAASQSERVPRAQLKIESRFSRDSRLRVLVYIYNVANGTNNSPPEVDIQFQVLRHNGVLFSIPPQKVAIAGAEDLRQLPFAEELSLAHLSAGRYLLRVIVTNRISKKSVSREVAFQVDQ